MPNLCLTVAEKMVRDYTDESDRLMQDHFEAMDCRDCEAFLRFGINAYRWLCRADEFLREADAQGVAEYSSDMQVACDVLYEAWMAPCDFAEKWIDSNLQRGFAIDNLQEFRTVCQEARETLQNREWRRAAKRARALVAAQEGD